MRLDTIDNVRTKTERWATYLQDKHSGIIIAFACSGCGEVYTLDDEDEFLEGMCHECCDKLYDYEDVLDRRRRILFFEEHGYPDEEPVIKEPKPGDFVF